jgi:hypothetical protein
MEACVTARRNISSRCWVARTEFSNVARPAQSVRVENGKRGGGTRCLGCARAARYSRCRSLGDLEIGQSHMGRAVAEQLHDSNKGHAGH